MPKLLHLGLGNFHRAHQAWYTHLANRDAAEPWQVIGVAMRNPALRNEMAAADWAYDLGVMDPGGLRADRIAVHSDVIVAAEEPNRVVAAIADPEVKAVTLTVTEKAYALDPTGALDLTDPTISADLNDGSTRSVIGLLAQGVIARAKRAGAPLTILSCDNLSGNGDLLKGALAAFLDAKGARATVLNDVLFPNTMVDRITPATTDDMRLRMEEAAGRPVVAPVLTEAFSEWVIEAKEGMSLPNWGSVGVVFTPNVSPYERRKLLLLNAAHSALAYGGLLKGHTYVHEVVADPDLHAQVRALWAEATPLLPEFNAADLATYQDALIDRFSVPDIAHRLSQIAMDGSQKLRQRSVPILRHHRFQAPAAAQVLNDWVQLMSGRFARGEPLDDPQEAALRRILSQDAPEVDRFVEAIGLLGLSRAELPEGFAATFLAARA